MKKNITGHICWIMLCMPLATFAQSTQDSTLVGLPKNVIKLAPFQFADNTFFLSYEGLNRDFTRSFNLGLGYKTDRDFNDDEEGVKIEVQYRFYFKGFKNYYSRRSLSTYRRGIYASIYLHSLITRINTEFTTFDPTGNFDMISTNRRNITAFNPGVTIGVQRTFWEVLYVDIFVGGGIRTASVRDSEPSFPDDVFFFSDIYQPEYEGVFPKIGVNIGFGF